MNSLCLLQRFVLFSGQEFEESGLTGRAGTQAARRTRSTILGAQMRRKPWITTGVAAFVPRERPVALGTAHLLALPVHHELIVSISLRHFVLPSGFGAGRTDYSKVMIFCTLH